MVKKMLSVKEQSESLRRAGETTATSELLPEI